MYSKLFKITFFSYLTVFLNSIIAACLAKGKTILKNCAIEPEIKDLTNFLNSAGANIKWIGKRSCLQFCKEDV